MSGAPRIPWVFRKKINVAIASEKGQKDPIDYILLNTSPRSNMSLICPTVNFPVLDAEERCISGGEDTCPTPIFPGERAVNLILST